MTRTPVIGDQVIYKIGPKARIGKVVNVTPNGMLRVNSGQRGWGGRPGPSYLLPVRDVTLVGANERRAA